ncbi:MICAL-like protein 2 [Platichthys flesus]|uniref:MICAL-like protein 2 n=1 Tax=Platichthys flesus TaxID=8260 RepID=UPI002DBDBE4F|nr:MICAL-like protein 2 [Platichthys flesus]
MSAVKALQQWCRLRCEGYRDVAITNMTTSFRDGLAFCALIHRHRPELIDFESLKKDNVYDNNKLAFKVADEELGIPALLDAEDMVAMKVPDRLSILTYVSQYYNYFHGRSPIGGMAAIKRPAEAATDEPSGKKNQAVVAKVFPGSKPARENSPPRSSPFTRPPPSPKPSRDVTKDVPVERSHQTGTLSNKCASCDKHVHLVQRHLVEGKLYHRSCAKSLSSANTLNALRDLPTNNPVSKFAPLPDTTKTSITTPPQASSRLGPTWLTEKPSPPSTLPTTVSPSPPYRPHLGVSSSAKETPTPPVSKPAAPRTTGESTVTQTTSISPRPVAAPRTSTTAAKTVKSRFKFFQSNSNNDNEEKKTTTIDMDIDKPVNVSGKVQEAAAGQAVTVVLNIGGGGGGAGKKEITPNLDKGGDRAKAAGGVGKVSSKQEDGESNKTKAAAGGGGGGKVSFKPEDSESNKTKASAAFISGKKETTPNLDKGGDRAKAAGGGKVSFKPEDAESKNTNAAGGGGGGKVSFKPEEAESNKTKAAGAAAFISGKNETTPNLDKGGDRAKAAGGGGKVSFKPEEAESNKTKAAAAVAAAFISKKQTEENNNNSSSKPTWTSASLKKPDTPAQVETPKKETGGVRGRVKLRANPSLLADLLPVDPPTSTPTSTPTPASRGGLRTRTPERGDPKPRSPSPSPSASENESPADWRSKLKPVGKDTKPAAPPPWANGAGKPQNPEPSPGPPSHGSTPSVPVTSPPWKGFQNVPRDQTANGTKSESKTSKMKPDYIPKEDIMKELQNIEDSLNELERRGVELEVKLRGSEEEGEDEDEVMVEWFNLIRNKQVAMRRESELVYIGKTQDLEEQQPSVELELRRLIDKPDRLKTAMDRKREKELMDKLVEIVNDRNAIVDGLDEDRLREDEEDQELNKLMMNFTVKKDKPKKKAKLFSWGSKKEG